MGFDQTISSEQRQGKYGSKRYHGKYNFGTTGYNPDTMTLTTAKLYLTATASGKSASRDLWLRADSSTDSSIIAKSNGSKYSVSRQATNEINLLSANSNAVTALKNGYFGMYVSQSNDDYYFTDSTGTKYSTHYIKFSKARLLLEWVYKNGMLKLNSDSVNVGSSGSSLTATVDNYQANYYYKLIVSVGSITQTYNIGTNSSHLINFADSTWQTAVTNGLFAKATSIAGTITLQTFSDSNYTVQMGSDSSVVITFVGTGLTAPTLTTGSISYINSKYNQITNFAVSGDGSAIVEYTATGQQGASIASRNVSSVDGFTSHIETSKITLTPNSTVKSGTYTFTLNVTDSRGLPESINFSIIVKKYNGPTPIIKSVGRKAVAGVEQISIQYSSSFFEGSSFDEGCIIVVNSNKDIVVNQDAGKLSAASGIFTTNISGGVSEVEHTVFLYITDSWGSTNQDERTLVPADYYLFFGAQTSGTTENGISLGIGGAALTISNTVYSHWPLKLKSALELSEGGTGAAGQEGAWINIVAPGGIIKGPFGLDTESPEILLKTNGTLRGNIKTNIINNTATNFQFWQLGNNNGYEVFTLPATTLNSATNKYYEILTTKDYPTVSDFYIQPNTTLTFSDIWSIGHCSSSKERLYFSIPIRRDLSKISKVTVQVANAQVRQGGKYLCGSTSSAQASILGTNRWVDIHKENNTLQLFLEQNGGWANAVNNEVCQASFGTLTLLFE